MSHELIIEGKEMKKEEIKKANEYKRTRPKQLELFSIVEKGRKGQTISNTIELYDAIPKYFWGKQTQIDQPLERDFVFRGCDYNVTVAPGWANLLENGKKYMRYPGVREELVEDALRKLATDPKKNAFLDDQAGVLFTIYELQRELKDTGHTYSWSEIRDALVLCSMTTMILRDSDNTKLYSSPIFTTLALNDSEDGDCQAFVRFHPLVTKSIQEASFRRLDYTTSMKYKRVLARWLHKRMSHVFTQASEHKNYQIKLTTIIRDSGVKRQSSLKKNLEKVLSALDEMKHLKTISAFEVNEVWELKGSRNVFVDAMISIQPSYEFCRQMKAFNSELRERKSGMEV